MLATAVLLLASSVGAQQFSAQISSIPSSDGAELRGEVTARWNDELSSSVHLLSDFDTTKGPIEGFDGSLLASRTNAVEATAEALRYSFDLGGVLLSLGGGARYYREAVDEDGVFALADENQQFDNDYSLTLLGPDVGVSVRGGGPVISASARLNVSPIAFYLVDQQISISPLVDDDGSADERGTATFFADARLDLELLGLLAVKTIVRTAGFDITLLRLGADGSDYVFVELPSNVRNTETTLTGSLLLDIQQIGSLEIGGGYRWSRSHNLTDDSVNTITEPVFSFSLSI